MRTPVRLHPLLEEGLIDEVHYALMSGKEASVYVVQSAGRICCAKVYKDARQRSFKKAAQYQEGRKVRNSRRARAMEKGSGFGREQAEESWQSAEVDALFKLAAAGVRVPTPYGCYDGVLLMELVVDAEGDVAPRLNDISLTAEQARQDHHQMMQAILQMLAVGLVHGDLSEFNVLQGSEGPVIIDLPQAADAAANNNARWMLKRDVDNITAYYARFAPELAATRYADEIWALFEAGNLDPRQALTGCYNEQQGAVDLEAILSEIQAASDEAALRRARQQAEPE
ncbi:protein of unknown function RIO1 [Alishewanella aestuarii B11]|uniref:non-specific serine/threonine protein kinase n=1 Tax=Alishewanella aestuarii B11 TaxID=1197174 RepID=J1YCI8_9ALTE|nr:PA4780 family RIO1-like protein kinase [Alishewanella aestuarii]EJI85595.1 protein of unknown function RIO1 [Alishewanella aestuarii B11]